MSPEHEKRNSNHTSEKLLPRSNVNSLNFSLLVALLNFGWKQTKNEYANNINGKETL